MPSAIPEALAAASVPYADSPLLPAAVLAVAAGALLAGLRARRNQRLPHDRKRRPSAAVVTATVAALVCTAYSADTSWRFAAHYLDMRNTAERTTMFSAAELALFSMALMARQNLHGPRRTAGLPGVLVWVITAMQTIPAYAESGPVGGTVRAFTGPVMAAVLWHLAMGIELRQRTPEAASHGFGAVLTRRARERLLARLGVFEQDQGAAEIIRDRATQRAVALATRLAEMTPGQRTERAGRRTIRRLAKALARSGIDADPFRNEQLLRQLATRRQAAALATVDLPERWSLPVGQPLGLPTVQPGSFRAEVDGQATDHDRADRDGRAEDHARPHPSDPVDGAPDSGACPNPTDHSSPKTAARSHQVSRRQDAAPPPTGSTSLTPSAKHHTPKSKRSVRKPSASDEVILASARRVYEETGSVGRDRVEDAVRDAGYSVSSNVVGRVVREFKSRIGAAHADS